MATHTNYIDDRPATEDTLGRSYFAEALSRSLVLPKGSPGLVVGIEGNWGSGKSTLIGFITKKLGEITKGSVPIVVEFNPWMVSNTGALVEALIGQIAASIGKDLSSGQKGLRVGQKLLHYVALLKHLKYVPGLGWAGHLAEDIPDIVQGAATVAEQGAEAGQKAMDDFKKLLPSLDLSQKKIEVVVALGELDRPIVVVIDDLDRLPAEEIRAMIQAVKAVADFPRITYLLAYDRSIIARALRVDEETGLSYLEKIVQVAYPIPPLSQRQLKKFANDKMQALLNELHITLLPYEQDRYEEAIALLTKLARHPRDIVRIINRLILSLPATHGEVNGADVIVFEALSQRFPALREAIHSHSADFTGHASRGDLNDEKDAHDWGNWADLNKDETKQPWLKHLPNDGHDQRISEKACLFLFPKQEKDGDYIIYENYLRIADPDRLARLFRMTSIEEVPEAKMIHELLTDPKKLGDALSIEDDEQLLFFLEWLINYTPSCPSPDVKGCIKRLADISQRLTNQYKLVDEVANKFADLMTRLLQLKTAGYEACFLMITQNAPLSIAENIILLAAADQGKWKIQPERRVTEDRQLISNNALVDQSIKTWSERVRESVAQGNLYKEANLYRVLYRFAQFNGAYEYIYDAINKMCETDEGLTAFLRKFKEENIFYDDQLALVENAEKLAQHINNSTLSNKYLWLVELLRKEETIKTVSEQSAKLKQAEQ